MTKHLVSTLRKVEKLTLRDEIVDRLEVAEASLREFSRRRNLEYDQLPPDFVGAVVSACLSGMGFAPEEVRGLQRLPPRSRASPADEPIE